MTKLNIILFQSQFNEFITTKHNKITQLTAKVKMILIKII
jgi:hypothetical protein